MDLVMIQIYWLYEFLFETPTKDWPNCPTTNGLLNKLCSFGFNGKGKHRTSKRNGMKRQKRGRVDGSLCGSFLSLYISNSSSTVYVKKIMQIILKNTYSYQTPIVFLVLKKMFQKYGAKHLFSHQYFKHIFALHF